MKNENEMKWKGKAISLVNDSIRLASKMGLIDIRIIGESLVLQRE